MSSPSQHEGPLKLFSLGALESEVLAVVCEEGGVSVGDVRGRLSKPFAYTTVMTTLDRLYKKDLLDRRKAGRRFLYAPRTLRQPEDGHCGPAASTRRWPVLTLSAFASYLLDAVGTYDEALLQELERTIANRRQQFQQPDKQADKL